MVMEKENELIVVKILLKRLKKERNS
jgi:hypothetical protein